MKSTRKMTHIILAMLLGLLAIADSNQAFAQGGTWETKAPMPTARNSAASGVINGKLYVAGGHDGTNYLATLEVYDPATDTWTTKAPMPTARNSVGGGVINSKLYVVGGQNAYQKLATLEVYDPATDTWTTKASIPTSRSSPGVVAIDAKLYVVGGCQGWCAPVTGVLEVYDSTTNTWTTKASMPTARGIADVAVVDGLFYVMGGCCGWTGTQSEQMSKTIEVYNPTTNTWATKTQHIVGGGDTAGSINGKIYVAKFADSEVYDPATDTWASLSPMTVARYYAAGGVINGKLYVAGGWGGTAVSATLEAFTPANELADATPPTITPTVSGTLGNDGWYTSNVTVSWTVADPESPITSMSGCGTSNVTSDTAGVTFTCTATSAGGTASNSVTIKRDATPPTISGSRSPGPNPYGWNNTDITASFTCNDALSGVGSCAGPTTLTGEGAGQSVTGVATDKAGNSASATVGNISIDKTPPTISGSRTPGPNPYGWNNSDVSVSFTCDDALSGVSSCSGPTTLTDEGAGQSVTGVATDKAGNSASATVGNISIDKTPPTVTYSGNAGSYTVEQSISITCSAADGLSGVSANTCADIAGDAYTFPLGTNTHSATATDKAGNVGQGSGSFVVRATFDSLCSLTRQFVTKEGVANSLCAKLEAAGAAANRGNQKAKAGTLEAYKNEVAAQSGKSLTAEQAAVLIRLSNAL